MAAFHELDFSRRHRCECYSGGGSVTAVLVGSAYRRVPQMACTPYLRRWRSRFLLRKSWRSIELAESSGGESCATVGNKSGEINLIVVTEMK